MNATEFITDQIADMTGLDANELLPDSRLNEEIGLDSLDMCELTNLIEQEFSIDISNAEMERCETLRHLVELVEKHQPHTA